MSIPVSAAGGVPRFEVPTGAVNGSNRTFRTQYPYTAETTSVFINGKMYRRDWEDGWSETDPDTGVFDLNEAPLLGDDVQVFYIDRTTSPKAVEVQMLVGRIRAVQEIAGVLRDDVQLKGIIGCCCGRR